MPASKTRRLKRAAQSQDAADADRLEWLERRGAIDAGMRITGDLN